MRSLNQAKRKYTILESKKEKISSIDMGNINSIFEDFFITSISQKDSLSQEMNELQSSFDSDKIGQCGHEICMKLSAYKPELIFRFPQREKNSQHFIISDLVTSLCFPYGIKICFNG